MRLLFYSACVIPAISADMYWQWPGGGNNRLNEPDNDRDNANRLFDSQNNDNHGFNLHHYKFYTGTELPLSWTLQHSCGEDSNIECQTIVQYACKDDDSRQGIVPDRVKMREGRNTNTINLKNEDDVTRGMHENGDSYRHCRLRERNQGLFPADQLNIGQNTNARFTRQDNAGTTYGFECPEERDYYPYWQPTFWKDIVIQTDNPNRQQFPNNPKDNRTVCEFYQQESENVKDRSFCYVPSDELKDLDAKVNDNQYIIPITELGCKKLADEKNGSKIKWTVKKAHGINKPDCVKSLNSRDNHHGNAQKDRQMESYKWIVPDSLADKECTIRLRYNMSSPETDNWNIERAHKIEGNNDNQNPQKENQDYEDVDPNRVGPDMWSKYGWNSMKGMYRGYKHRNDQRLLPLADSDLRIQMSYNTDQLARTFQDRTFLIKFEKKPNSVGNKKIHILTGTGKIGSNLENYPNFMYDFYPSTLSVDQGDYLHIQFSGSSNYDKNNDASITDELGRQYSSANVITSSLGIKTQIAGKWRMNMVPLKKKRSLSCDNDQMTGNDLFLGLDTQSLKNNPTKNAETFIEQLAIWGVYGDDGQTEIYGKNKKDENIAAQNLDLRSFAVDHGLVQLNKPGQWSFMSSHGHKFGGNIVKGTVIVKD